MAALPVKPINRPRALDGLTNGKIPADRLVHIPGLDGGPLVKLIEPAARAWVALADVAATGGHTLKAASAADSFRPYAVQESIFLDRYRKTYKAGTDVKIWNGVRWYRWFGATAAVPGTSNHGWGMAVDTGVELDTNAEAESLDRRSLSWLLAHADRFGWSWELQSEIWHLHYYAGDRIPAAVVAHEGGTFDPTPEEDDMPAQILWFTKPTASDPHAAHAYRVENGHAKHLTHAALDLCRFLGVVETAAHLGKDFQAATIIVDGPCQNVR